MNELDQWLATLSERADDCIQEWLADGQDYTLALAGPQGSGKSLFVQAMARSKKMGVPNVHETNLDDWPHRPCIKTSEESRALLNKWSEDNFVRFFEQVELRY